MSGDNGAWHGQLVQQETGTHTAWSAHRRHEQQVERVDQREESGPELEINPH